MIRILALLALTGPAAAAADLTMPYPGTPSLSETRGPGSHRVAIGPFADTLPQVTAEGAVTRRVWKLTAPEATTLQLLDPLRTQLEEAGWDIAFTCATRACGGFDFRFEIDVTPAPDMFVDLADFRYLAARRGGAWTTLVVSKSGELGFVQVTIIDPEAATDPRKSTANQGPAPGAPADTNPDGAPPDGSGTDDTATGDTAANLARALRSVGRAVLPDLDFATGSTELAGDSYASLQALAAFLEANPDVTIALVGHTDAEGAAEANMALSRRRADSARRLLTGRYGVAGTRVETQGVGFFAPRARNDTEAGRQANRRVEVVITSTE